jgi:hypothetical protein
MTDIIFGIFDLIVSSLWTLIQIISIFVILKIVRRKKIESQKVALLAFILLAITAVLNIFKLDLIAGKISEYILILFGVAFIQQFHYFLKTRNNSKNEE